MLMPLAKVKGKKNCSHVVVACGCVLLKNYEYAKFDS
jgi:hypothetical protein